MTSTASIRSSTAGRMTSVVIAPPAIDEDNDSKFDKTLTPLQARRIKSGLPRKFYISSARKALHDLHDMLDSDRTYELYIALANKIITNVDVLDQQLGITALTKVACHMPKWDDKKRDLWMRILIKFGADVNATNDLDQTIVAQLIIAKKLNIFMQLIEADKKAVLNFMTVDRNGNNLLHLACQSGLTKAAHLILLRSVGYGVPLHEAYNNLGQTPLMVACDGGDISMAKVLIDSGADLTVREANCRYGSQMAIETLEGTLLRNQPNKVSEIKQTLEQLIRSSCKYMIRVGQMAKMARLLRWCATSILGQDKARELCREFRPQKPTHTIAADEGFLKKSSHHHNHSRGHSNSGLKQKVLTAAEENEKEAALEVDSVAQAFDLPKEAIYIQGSDNGPAAMQIIDQSPVYSLLSHFSYSWSPTLVGVAPKGNCHIRPSERHYLVNASIINTPEETEALNQPEQHSRLGHRMSISARSRQSTITPKLSKRQPSSMLLKAKPSNAHAITE